MNRASLMSPVLVAALAGCSAEYDVIQEGDVADHEVYPPDDEADLDSGAEALSSLRLDVTPPEGLSGPRGRLYLPQSFTVDAGGGGYGFALSEPVLLSGAVTGYVTAPYRAADLPGVDGPIGGARVSLRRPAGLESANDVSDPDTGTFRLWVPPASDFLVSYLPSDPGVPFRTDAIALLDDLNVDIALDVGVAVWGQVLQEDGSPVVGVPMSVEGADGQVSATVWTDDAGWYVLRVTPGTWTIRSAGREGQREPSLAQRVAVGAEGAAVDFVYADLSASALGGRVIDDRQQGVAGAVVQLVSTSLEGYEDASYQVEVSTTDEGNFDTRLPPGRYRASVIASGDLTGVDLGEVVVDAAFEDLGTTVLPSFVHVSGLVTDEAGGTVAGASITMEEGALGRRAFTTFADSNGAFTLSVPRSSLSAWVAPPALRTDLAVTRIDFEPTAEVTPVFVVSAGVPISGRVTAVDGSGRSTGVSFGLVEVIDGQGDRWGAALTDGDGAFALRVARVQ